MIAWLFGIFTLDFAPLPTGEGWLGGVRGSAEMHTQHVGLRYWVNRGRATLL